MSESAISGLHHITVIAGLAHQNFAFYQNVMGMRLVKKSVNQDAPNIWHLFYADAAGSPGTDLTFFPWAHLAGDLTVRPGVRGHGIADRVSLAVPPNCLDYWKQRLSAHEVQVGDVGEAFGEKFLTLSDADGLQIRLVEADVPEAFAAWPQSTVPEAYQIHGLHSARLLLRNARPTIEFLEHAMGFSRHGDENDEQRWSLPGAGSGCFLDIIEDPAQPPARMGPGITHHLAWRVKDEAAQLSVRQSLLEAGMQPTPPIDRFWFKSVYFNEPGGVIFEIATDGPGFTRDESPETLGQKLILPPWLESQRASIQAALPPLEDPELD